MLPPVVELEEGPVPPVVDIEQESRHMVVEVEHDTIPLVGQRRQGPVAQLLGERGESSPPRERTRRVREPESLHFNGPWRLAENFLTVFGSKIGEISWPCELFTELDVEHKPEQKETHVKNMQNFANSASGIFSTSATN
jgi:hypothetical protein